MLCFVFYIPNVSAQQPVEPEQEQPATVQHSHEVITDTVEVDNGIFADRTEISDDTVPADTLAAIPMAALTDSVMAEEAAPNAFTFNPDPTRAVWMSALFPGLGQLYNRRYWKLPIVVGGFMGISYALSWNNRMLNDYTQAYRDITDSDPSTKSYLDFFPRNTKEEDLDAAWLEKTLKSRKDFYRRNRDLSIICMVGMYLLCLVDAYVDASLSHFDISPDISMNVAPAIIEGNRNGIPSVGLHWGITF